MHAQSAVVVGHTDTCITSFIKISWTDISQRISFPWIMANEVLHKDWIRHWNHITLIILLSNSHGSTDTQTYLLQWYPIHRWGNLVPFGCPLNLIMCVLASSLCKYGLFLYKQLFLLLYSSQVFYYTVHFFIAWFKREISPMHSLVNFLWLFMALLKSSTILPVIEWTCCAAHTLVITLDFSLPIIQSI